MHVRSARHRVRRSVDPPFLAPPHLRVQYTAQPVRLWTLISPGVCLGGHALCTGAEGSLASPLKRKIDIAAHSTSASGNDTAAYDATRE